MKWVRRILLMIVLILPFALLATSDEWYDNFIAYLVALIFDGFVLDIYRTRRYTAEDRRRASEQALRAPRNPKKFTGIPPYFWN